MKKDIRKNMILIRSNLLKYEVESFSFEIYKNIKKWDMYVNSNTIMVYSDIRNEVKTNHIINDCIMSGKTLVLPKTVKVNNELLPCIVKDLSELKKGVFGIMEPEGDRIADKNNIDLIIVPGVAFDKNGYRIGYGAGYYDRFLKDYKGIKAGICYSFQVIENTFPDEYDICMDYLITERGITKIGDR